MYPPVRSFMTSIWNVIAASPQKTVGAVSCLCQLCVDNSAAQKSFCSLFTSPRTMPNLLPVIVLTGLKYSLMFINYDKFKNLIEPFASALKPPFVFIQVSDFYSLILEDFLYNLTSNVWRNRESSFLALNNLLQVGRAVGGPDQALERNKYLVKKLPEMWKTLLRVADDIKETVRLAAINMCKRLKKLRTCLRDLDDQSFILTTSSLYKQVSHNFKCRIIWSRFGGVVNVSVFS